MFHNNDEVEATYRQAILRLTNVARELAAIVRKDSTLYSRVSSRTKRWIKKQDAVDQQRLDAKDAALRLAKRKRTALAKLTLREQALLGLINLDDIDENLER